MAELKPCPFCGGEAVFLRNSHTCYETSDVYHVSIVCSSCHAGTESHTCQIPDQLGQTIGYKPYTQAVKEVYKLWNRRVDNG